MNRALLTSLASIGIAQALKIPTARYRNGRWDWKELWTTGGMPSSHSAGVASLATYIGLKKGIASIPFALSTMLGLIVMYDAMGIRRHAGLIAMQVNDLEEEVGELSRRHPSMLHTKRERELEERLGHVPEEVAGGALLGMLLGAISFIIEPKRSRSRRSSKLR
ncbi:divergent PAP2 family protein [Paenibacillus silviterrae]|uniref:divergent PAP2 family protein n=1 Tax=Paenibacillus silviterrae TaxID=3242194 RepID=UPI0025436A5D|nr:divergent PAP2 family protein [Paenibacillus chinjuensis]